MLLVVSFCSTSSRAVDGAAGAGGGVDVAANRSVIPRRIAVVCEASLCSFCSVSVLEAGSGRSVNARMAFVFCKSCFCSFWRVSAWAGSVSGRGRL